MQNIPLGYSEEDLRLLFENQRRSGGGAIEELVLKDNGRAAVITFSDIHGE